VLVDESTLRKAARSLLSCHSFTVVPAPGDAAMAAIARRGFLITGILLNVNKRANGVGTGTIFGVVRLQLQRGGYDSWR